MTITTETWIAISLGFLGILFGYYYYKKSLRVPDPRATLTTVDFLSYQYSDTLPKGIEIFFKKEKVPRIAASKIRIWNAGAGCLTKDLIAENDVLKLKLKDGGKFLYSAILAETSKAIVPNVTINENDSSEVKISFDFINQNEGFSFGIYHTSNELSLTLEGSLKGCEFKIMDAPIIDKHKGHERWAIPLIRFWLPILTGILLIISAMFPDHSREIFRSIIYTSNNTYPLQPISILRRVIVALTGLPYVALGLMYYRRRRRIFPKRLK